MDRLFALDLNFAKRRTKRVYGHPCIFNPDCRRQYNHFSGWSHCRPQMRQERPCTTNNELSGNILAVVGTLNAVLLGLVIVEAQSRFQQARTNEAAESSTIADMRMYAEYLPEPTKSAIDRHVEKYVKTQSFDLRRFRITTSQHGLPVILWTVLITCSVITVICTYFLAAKSLMMHAVLVTLLSLTLSMGILVVWVLGNPYTGDWKIRPDQFMRITTSGFPITNNSDPFVKESTQMETKP